MALDRTLLERSNKAVHGAAEPELEEALRHATEFLDTIPYKGERLTQHQSLSWPRKGVYRDDGAPVIGVPQEVVQATSLVAGFILAKVPFGIEPLTFVFAMLGNLVDEPPRIPRGRVSWH